jgi:DNA modification methylase
MTQHKRNLKSSTALPRYQLVDIGDVRPSADNPRIHSRQQIRAIAKSIKAFGFAAPLLIDKNKQIIAGHGRYEAAKFLELRQVPCIFLDRLTEAQAKAYRLADNQLNTRSVWDDKMVALQLKELAEMALDFDIEAIGFELPELDFRIASLDEPDATDRADEFALASGPSVSVLGDLWLLGDHRLYCGNALEDASYTVLMNGEKAAGAFIDCPYNLKIDGHVGGKGRIKHREFAMATGEMSKATFADFLIAGLKPIGAHTIPGAVVFSCIDWRSVEEMLAAGKAAAFDLLNICVWVKSNGGMGSFYRSRHELVMVFRNGTTSHQNNVQLGRHGRNRANVWNYPGVNTFGRKGTENLLSMHPTCKPIAMVADAIMDCTGRGDIVLDSFLGSGTTILAAERTGRRGYGIELDPLYVDTAVERWQRLTDRQAVDFRGETYDRRKTMTAAAHG